MKLPRKLVICGREWDIVKDPLVSGAEFDCHKAEMRVGSDYGKEELLQLFLHEILEVIFQERGHRYHLYCNGENEKQMFVFDHAQFTNIVMDLAGAIKGIIK